MTATISTPSVTTENITTKHPVARATAGSAVLAAPATEAFTGVVRASGVDLRAGDIGGTARDVVAIGPGACTIMIAICALAGFVLAALLNRFAARPRRTYLLTTSALVAMSFVPDVLAGATATSTKLTLIAAHVIAAAIIVPMVARRLK